jgi:hypothetical protein
MPGRAIKIDKRLPLFIGGRAGDIKSDRSLIPSLAGLRAQAAEDLSFKVGSPPAGVRLQRRPEHADATGLFFLKGLPGALYHVTHDNHQSVPLLFRIFCYRLHDPPMDF